MENEIDIVDKLIPLKFLLKEQNKFLTISQKVMKKLDNIVNIDDLKHNPELINFICNLIEYYVKKKYNINKENMLIYICNKAFKSMSDEDTEKIKDIVKYLHNNKLIVKISNSQYLKEYLKKFFLFQFPKV